MDKRSIYLDHNATTFVLPEVREAVMQLMDTPYNASSVHGFGQDARAMLHNARQNIASMVHASDVNVIFTSSGTEANNLVVSGIKNADSIAVSAVEHVSILVPAQKHKKASIIPVNADGKVELDTLRKVISNARGKTLVSIMLANNETGILQDIAEIAQLVRNCGGYLHCDAIQAVGKIPVDFDALGVDLMTVSAHKIGGMQGAAALIARKDIEIDAQILGGQQEKGFRAGTENIAAIHAFGVAATLNHDPMSSDARDYLEQRVHEISAGSSNVVIIGQGCGRLPSTSCIALRHMSSETQLINFDLAGIAVSNGSACSSGTVKKSHVMAAMGIDDSLATSVIRVSLSKQTTRDDIDAFLGVWEKNYKKVEHKLAKAA